MAQNIGSVIQQFDFKDDIFGISMTEHLMCDFRWWNICAEQLQEKPYIREPRNVISRVIDVSSMCSGPENNIKFMQNEIGGSFWSRNTWTCSHFSNL